MTRGQRRLETIAVAGLLAFAAFIFFWNLDASGYANEFYSAAAQAGSKSWSAFLWGSLDAGGAITVDKPPASIWLMALSVRLLGLSPFAILLPQALMGVATTLAVYLIARRCWGAGAGLLAGILFATTPVAALMFRFNNPDALLVLLMTLAADCVIRALARPATRAGNRGRTALIALAGALVGIGFLTKQFQVLLVVPGFALALFALSPTPWRRRLLDGTVAIASIAAAAGWWVALTVIVPSGSRPYIGGSQTDSFLELTLGYNGLGRLTGDETGSVAPGGNGQAGMWGETGIGRLLGSDFAGQFAWFALFSLAGIIICLIAARSLRARREGIGANGAEATARFRYATVTVFGCWLTITWLVFSFMSGIFHQYYTVALAPAVALLSAGCLQALFELRERPWAPCIALVLSALSITWAFVLIGRVSALAPIAVSVLAVGLIGCVVGGVRLLAGQLRGGRPPSRAGRIASCAAVGAIALSLIVGPAIWTGCTIATGHRGSIVTAGPSEGGMGGGQGSPGGQDGGQGDSGAANAAPQMDDPGDDASADAGGTDSPGGQDGGQGGVGSLLGGSSASNEVTELLLENAQGYRWAAATTGSQNAASYQLASELPVMAIGGFNGTDPAPTLEQFKAYVEQGLVRYYIASGDIGGKAMGGSDTASQVETWVEENFEAQTVGSTTIYDLAS